jgi:hypothetical protein
MNFKSLFIIAFGSCVIVSCGKTKSEEIQLKPIEEQPQEEIKDAIKPAGAILSADGITNTYTLINKVFGGTGDVLETPDCAHAAHGPHIRQVYDDLLKKYVFAFDIHVTPDNDRCNNATDRQRNEIKTYDKSPDSLKAALNESVEYSWKFKLDAAFKPSSNFTHLHQIKPIDGDADMPMITLTARYKASGDQMELIHNAGEGKTTSLRYIASIPLSDFKGQWVEVTEKITYSYTGKYEISIKRLSDNKELLAKKVAVIDMWRDGTTQCRPKWGIYRSLLSPSMIRDETILFDDFKIREY